MKRVCFVCLGNICRSPMAEFMMKNKVKELGLENEYLIESRGTSYEEEGNDLYPPAKEMLTSKNVPYTRHHAKRLEKEDYEQFDIFYCMEDKNISASFSILGGDPSMKITRLLDHNISDPWYTGDFLKTYVELEEGIKKILSF